MKKLSFALFSDALFFALCAFMISFTVIRFYVKKNVTALILSICVALAVGVIAFIALITRRKKHLSKLLGENEKKSLALHLSVCSEKKISDMFNSALEGTKADGAHLSDESREYFFNFKMAPLTADDVAAVIKAQCEKTKCVYCCAISPDALSLAEDFNIEVNTIAETYVLLKEKNLLPEKYALGEVKKPNVLKKIKKRFNRRICPSLFFCGLSLLFFSFFTFYPVYYIVFGGIMMVLSAISLLIEPTKR